MQATHAMPIPSHSSDWRTTYMESNVPNMRISNPRKHVLCAHLYVRKGIYALSFRGTILRFYRSIIPEVYKDEKRRKPLIGRRNLRSAFALMTFYKPSYIQLYIL